MSKTSTRHSYVRFFPSDWIAGTSRLPRLHRSVYFDVCLYNWDKGKPVPMVELRMMVADIPNGMEIVNDLIDSGKLFVCEGTGEIANPRAMAEAIHSFDQWEKRSRGGKTRAQEINSGRGDNPQPKPKRVRKRSTPAKSPASTPDGSPDKKYPEPEPEDSNADASESNESSFSAPQPEWSEFAKFRKRIGKPLTPHAVKLNLAALERLTAEGYDPRAVLNQSIANGWAGLHPTKEDSSRRGKQQRTDGRQSGRTSVSDVLFDDIFERDAHAAAAKHAGRGDAGGSGQRAALPRPDRTPEEGSERS